MWRRLAGWLLPGVLVVSLGSPASAAGGAGGPVIALHADRTASAGLVFAHPVTLRPTFHRPGRLSCDRNNKPWLRKFVLLEITTQRPSPFVAFAIVWCDTNWIAGQTNRTSDGGTGFAGQYGFFGGSGRSGCMQTPTITLPAGRYRFTVVTPGPTTVDLTQGHTPDPQATRIVPCPHQRPQHWVHAVGRVAFDERSASFTSGGVGVAPYASLPLRVPLHSHLVLTMLVETYHPANAGYANVVCLIHDSLATSSVCSPAVVPNPPDPRAFIATGGGVTGLGVLYPPSGPSHVDFVSGDPGVITHREVWALALP